MKAETQKLIDREAFEAWLISFTSDGGEDDIKPEELSKVFSVRSDKYMVGEIEQAFSQWKAILDYCRKNLEKVLEPTHYSELYKKEYEYKGNNFMDVSLAKTVTGLVYDYEVTGIRRWVELPVTYVVQYKDEDTREWQQKQFPTYEEAKQWLKENGLHEK